MRPERSQFPGAWAVLSYLLVPAAVLSLLWKGIFYRRYLYRWAERFALGLERRGDRTVWVHAVSVGEVRSSVPLIRELMARYPHHRMLVTTMTPTGAEQVDQLFGDAVEHLYLPYDLPDAVARFLDAVRPSLAVIAETEFWPNLFAACRRREIPLVLANVRISAHSLSGYQRVSAIARTMFRSADLVCAQTRTDAQRLRSLGVSEHQLVVTGNLKFDVPVIDAVLESGIRFRRKWGDDRFVWVAGSTHHGEEDKLLRVFAKIRLCWSNALLVIVPRDPERFAGVARLARRHKFVTAVHTAGGDKLDPRVEVLIGDTMGQLQEFYSAADLAFVGASLVRRGGHNVLEAGAVGVPVIFGPHMFNFEEIAAGILEAGAGKQIYDETELEQAVELYMSNPQLRAAAGDAARRTIASNSGSVRLTLECMARQVHQRIVQRDETYAQARHRAY